MGIKLSEILIQLEEFLAWGPSLSLKACLTSGVVPLADRYYN